MDDPWISQHSPLASEKLHAIGYIVTIWNSCEYWAEILFMTVAGTPAHVGHAITHNLGSTTLFNAIIDVARERRMGPDLIGLLQHTETLYEACRLNRNQVCHFGICGTAEGNRMARRKGPKFDALLLPDGIESIRRIAEDIATLLTFLQTVVRHFVDQQQGRQTPLPDKPIPPARLLIVSRDTHQQNTQRHIPAKPQHPPQSSRA